MIYNLCSQKGILWQVHFDHPGCHIWSGPISSESPTFQDENEFISHLASTITSTHKLLVILSLSPGLLCVPTVLTALTPTLPGQIQYPRVSFIKVRLQSVIGDLKSKIVPLTKSNWNDDKDRIKKPEIFCCVFQGKTSHSLGVLYDIGHVIVLLQALTSCGSSFYWLVS